MAGEEMTVARARDFVRAVAEAYALGLAAAPGVMEPQVLAGPVAGSGQGGTVLICAPHPDDESLTGALPLRLGREDNCAVLALAVTLGSDPVRRTERWREFVAATDLLGWEGLPPLDDRAFTRLAPEDRAQQPAVWRQRAALLADLLDDRRPDLVLLPHGRDAHPTHVAVHHLVVEALALHSARRQRRLLVAASEFWRPLAEPNLLVGLAGDDVARLVAAVARHRGEVARQPYHVRLPFRMVDTVRRGSELLAGYGAGGAPLLFAEIYRLTAVCSGVPAAAAAPLVIGPEQRLTLAALQASGL